MTSCGKSAAAFALLAALAACNAGETLALAPGALPAPAPGAVVQAPGKTIAIAPVTGAPESFAAPLTKALAAEAASLGVTTSPTSSAYVLKGYVSALSESPGILYVYVWDLTDQAGNRVHRIQGQVKGPAGSPWQDDAAARRIASETADQLALWLAANAT